MFSTILKSLQNPVVLVLIIMLFAVVLIAGSLYLKDIKGTFFYISFDQWSQSLMIIGTTGLSVLIFKFLLTSNAVLKMVKKAMEESFLEFSFLDSYDEKKLETIAKKISEKSKFITLNLNEKKIKSIYHAKQDYSKMSNKKNFFIEDMTWIKTVFKNGNDIQNTIATLDITEAGNIDLEYNLESDFNAKIYPKYENFSVDRFLNYSFNVKITDYIRRGSKIAKENYPKLSYTCIKDNQNKKVFKICIEDCLRNDKFVIRISRTTLGEYTDEKVAIRRKEETKIATVDMKVPSGVRTIVFQEEIYGDNSQCRFKSNITTNGIATHIKPKEEESSFYITKTWEVFYDDHPKESIEFNLY